MRNTDMRKSIDGLAVLIREDPFEPALFLFGGKKCDCIKVLLWDDDGFLCLYKRLERKI